MRKIPFIILMVILCFLVGCNNRDKKEFSDDATNQTNKPPSITIKWGEKTIGTKQGGYRWSYYDFKTGQTVMTLADSDDPKNFVDIENAEIVRKDEPITIVTKKNPVSYEINVYNENLQLIASYNDIQNIKESGKVIIEISATWNEGEGIYATALDVQ